MVVSIRDTTGETTMKKIHEWLSELDSHGIYDAKQISENFKKETGVEPCWGHHSAGAIKAMIEARGLGGNFDGDEPAIAGYEIAEALAEKYGDTSFAIFHGRGSRFRAALASIEKSVA